MITLLTTETTTITIAKVIVSNITPGYLDSSLQNFMVENGIDIIEL